MISVLSSMAGFVIAAAISIGAVFLLFDINWLSAEHRSGLARLLSLPLDAYSVGHLYLLITHIVCVIAMVAGMIIGAKFLGQPLRYLFSNAGKLRYLAYLFYPAWFILRLAGRTMGKSTGSLFKMRLPRPRIEASIEWNTQVTQPFVEKTKEPDAPRVPITVSFDPTQTSAEPEADAPSDQDDVQEASPSTGLVYSDPMAEAAPAPQKKAAFDPDAGIAVVIDQLRELGYETRAQQLINAADGGWAPDIFDDDPMATAQLIAVDKETIYLIETLDLGGQEWTVETMADMHNRAWSDAKWRSPIAEIECPASNLARTRERFSSALLARLGMDPDQVICLLMMRNGKLANADALASFSAAEEIDLIWFDKIETIEPAIGSAEGKMSAILLNMITQTGRRAA